jgi:hypothetical protein
VGAGPSQDLLAMLRRRGVDEEARALARWRDTDGDTPWGWTQEVGPPTVHNPVSTTAPKKAAGYGWLLSLLEQERLVLARHPDLLRQLAGLRYEQGERGMTRIESDAPGLHDDVADALMLATAPFSRDGRTKCRLARFAQMRLPDAEVPVVADTVTKGGGLVLPRSLFWQSVNGPEVSLPTTLQAERPQEDHENPVLARARAYLATRRKESTK